ncbi:MAG: hypothetical protein AAF517_22805, partial [Planctomycetota bacterium]
MIRSRTRWIEICVVALSVSSTTVAVSQTTGDFDGDGQVTLADVLHRNRGLAAEEGSLDGFELQPCSVMSSYGSYISALTLLESVRRMVPDANPDWWRVWADHPATELEVTQEVILRLEDVSVSGGRDIARLSLEVENAVAIRAFSFVLVSNPAGLLRYRTVLPGVFTGSDDWSSPPTRTVRHELGEIPVHVPAPGALASRGRLPVFYNVSGRNSVLSPGVRTVVVEARLPKGLEAGEYSYSILPSSQVVLSNGRVFHPELEKSSARLDVTLGVAVGWDGPVPEFEGDELTGRLEGPVEFRVLGGEAPAGGVVSVRVQMRSAVPLNRLYVQLGWPGGQLECPKFASDGLPLVDEEGQPYQGSITCFTRGTLGSGYMSVRMSLAGHLSNISNQPERFLEAFHISRDTWTDVVRFDMTVSESLPEGTVIPLQFQRYDWDEYRTRSGLLFVPPPAVFYPFTADYAECGREHWADFEEERWTYDYRYQDGQIVVTEGGNPVEPPDIGLEITMGEARIAPGESGLVPVYVQADEVPRTLRVPVSFDAERVEIDAFEYDVLDFRTAEVVRVRVERDSIDLYSNCIELPDGRLECEYGIPYSTIFHSSPEGFAVIDLNPNPPFGDARDFLSPDEP